MHGSVFQIDITLFLMTCILQTVTFPLLPDEHIIDHYIDFVWSSLHTTMTLKKKEPFYLGQME